MKLKAPPRRLYKAPLTICVQMAFCSAAWANCVTNNVTTVCDSTSPNPYTTIVGSGPNYDNTQVTVGSGATISTQNGTAVSIGNNGTITVLNGGTIATNASTGGGPWSAGPNTVEFGSNNVINVEQGGVIASDGTRGNGEALNPIGFGNRITNNGLIYSRNAATLWFEDRTVGAKNAIDNYGIIRRIGGGNVIGASGNSGISIINRTGAIIDGSLIFAGGDDDLTLENGSSITGNINGGGGTNALTLQGIDGSSDTLPGNLTGFTTLTKNGLGSWTVSGTMVGMTIATVNNGTLRLTGNNAGYTGSVIVNSSGTLRANWNSLPVKTTVSDNTNNIMNAGAVIIENNNSVNGEYIGQITGAGSVTIQNTPSLPVILNPAASIGNTYTGGTTIDGAQLGIYNDLALGGESGSLTFKNKGTLTALNSLIFSPNRTITLTASDSGDVSTSGGIFNTNNNTIAISQGIEGAGNLEKTGAGTLYLDGANTYTGKTLIDQGTIEVRNFGALDSSSEINISPNSTLFINQPLSSGGNYISSANLTGQGLMNVNLGAASNTFSFNNQSTSGSFGGVLELQNSQFSLSGNNTSALKSAMLQSDSGNIVTVGDGTQNIGGLAFNGGTVIFDANVPANIKANSFIQTDKLVVGSSSYDITASDSTTRSYSVNGAGIVRINTPSPWNDPGPNAVDNSLNLLMQDDTNVSTQLIAANSVTGSGGGLQLQDQNGNAITSSTTINIAQDGNVVAQGDYDYRLTTAPGDGLYVNYGLKGLNILSGQTLTFSPDDGSVNAAADMSAKISGAGNLKISAGQNTVSLSNSQNDYQGATLVNSGTLLTSANNVLGNTSSLEIFSGAKTDLASTTQNIGTLLVRSRGTLDFDSGTLNVSNGGTSDGSLLGRGQLNINSGNLVINGANSALQANTLIASGAVASLNNASGLGSGNITNKGTLVLDGAQGSLTNNISDSGNVNLIDNASVALTGNNSDFDGQVNIENGSLLAVSSASTLGQATIQNEGTLSADNSNNWILNNAISGSGGLNKSGRGTLTLSSAAAAYTGTTTIKEGTLNLGSASAPIQLSSQQVNIQSDGTLSGYGGTTGSIYNAGVFQIGDSNQTTTTLFTVGSDLTNSGTTRLTRNSSLVGNQLFVRRNFIGNNGLLSMNTVLNDDKSATDSLTVMGNTSGNSLVHFTNVNGVGATTNNGIKVIQVNGNSAGTFTQQGRSVAGAYEYMLVRGSGSNAKNWYLTNNLTSPETSESDVQKLSSFNDSTSTDTTGTFTPNIRPEAASYIANLAAANNMFITSLHDRLGETQFIDALTGKQNVTSLWLRQTGGHNRSEAGNGLLKTQSNRYTVQLGGDITNWTSDQLDQFNLGVMAGYGTAQSRSHSKATEYSSRGELNGYSAGVYATWRADNISKQGLYVDSWLMHSWFNNDVQGEQLAKESYQSRGLTASLESGYTYKILAFNGSKDSLNEWFVQPQAQAIWTGVTTKAHSEENGTVVNSGDNGSFRTRLGVRTYLKGHSAIDNNTGKVFQPYLEANWIHNTRQTSINMNDVSVTQSGARNIGEIKTGVEGAINNHFNLWTGVALQVGSKSYSDAAINAGLKYIF